MKMRYLIIAAFFVCSMLSAQGVNVEKLRKAAEQGDADSQYLLGSCLDDGNGVKQDFKEAVKWYQKAAEQGDAYAQGILGAYFVEGNKVPQDYNEAIKWFRLAAEQGEMVSQFELGLCYAKGEGTAVDYVLALMWFNLAAAGGYEKATIGKDMLLKKLTPDQIEKALELARNWKPKNTILKKQLNGK